MIRTIALAALVLALAAAPAFAVEQVNHEREIAELRLGQRVLVDDGTCPQGQIKEISGASLSNAGVVRAARCIARAAGRR